MNDLNFSEENKSTLNLDCGSLTTEQQEMLFQKIKNRVQLVDHPIDLGYQKDQYIGEVKDFMQKWRQKVDEEELERKKTEFLDTLKAMDYYALLDVGQRLGFLKDNLSSAEAKETFEHIESFGDLGFVKELNDRLESVVVDESLLNRRLSEKQRKSMPELASKHDADCNCGYCENPIPEKCESEKNMKYNGHAEEAYMDVPCEVVVCNEGSWRDANDDCECADPREPKCHPVYTKASCDGESSTAYDYCGDSCKESEPRTTKLLIFYVNVGLATQETTESMMEAFEARVKKSLKNELVRGTEMLYIPVRNEQTRVEVLNLNSY